MDAEKQPQDQHQPQQEQGPALFFCHLCHSGYRQPKLLKCLHNFCMLCLRDSVIKDNGNESVVCPLCSYPTPLPRGGLEGLIDNSFLQRVSSEYVTGVRSHLAATKTSSPHTARKVSPCDAYIATSSLRRRLSEEMANLTDEQKTVSSRNLMYTSDTAVSTSETPHNGYSELRRTSVDRGEYTPLAMDAVQNMSRLQSKLISLQGEALRVTYAIDQINDHMTNWHQHKDDLKAEVQRRSHQFQVAAKKMERQILSQIEGKAMEDQFYAQLDRGKTELRKNLKNLLHEVSVLKSVHELGKFSEINQLSSSLLGPSVGTNAVVLDMLSYQLDIPTKSIEEMISVGFGNLLTTREEGKVYTPEIRDFTNIPADQLTFDVQPEQNIKALSTGAPSFERSRSRSTAPRRNVSMTGLSRKHAGDSGHGSTNVQEHLEQFQKSRESFRTRRQEILRQGQIAREDLSPLRGDARKLVWPNILRSRVQSLDRSSNTEERGRAMQRNIHGSTRQADSQLSQHSGDQGHREVEEKDTGKSEDPNAPFTIIEEGSHPSSPQKEVEADERVPAIYTTRSPSVKDNVETEHIPIIRRSRTPSLGSHSQQSSSDDTPPMSPTGENSSEGIKGGEGRRTLRKALSNATDKRSKLEFLRENWQKRKEILIQSQGFVSSEAATSPGKPKTDVSAVASTNLQTSDKSPSDSRGKEEQPEKSKLISPQATSNTAATNVSTISTSTQQEQQDLGKDKIGNQADEEDEEEEEVTVVTSETIAIPITGQYLRAMRENDSVIQDEQQQNKDKEEDEEATVITEMFVVDRNLSTEGTTKYDTLSTSHNVLPSSSKVPIQTENKSSIPVSTTRPEMSYSSSRHTSIRTATTTVPTVPSQQTSIPTAATLTAPSTSFLKSNRYSALSTSSTPARTASTTTTTTSTAPCHSSTITATTTSSTTTTDTSVGQISTTTHSTSTSSLGIYRRRYVPRTETIDVAALIANMYKPSSSSSSSSSSQVKEDKKKADEEKENAKNAAEKQTDIKSSDEVKSQSIYERDRGITRDRYKSTFSPNTTLNTASTSKADKPTSVDSALTKTKDITVYKITDERQNQKSLGNVAVSPSSSNQCPLSYGASQRDSTTPAVVTSENKTATETYKKVSFSEPVKPKDSTPPGYGHLKVEETFSEAESSRKRFDPASPKSSSQIRRHTVEISKTIPEGMRLSDMYKPVGTKELKGAQESGSDGQAPQLTSSQGTASEQTRGENLKSFKTGPLTSSGAIASTGSTSSSSSLIASDRVPDVSHEQGKLFVSLGASSVGSSESHSGSLSPSPSSPVSSTGAPSMSSAFSSMATSDTTAGQANTSNAAHGKMRDIARKKRERWRRLSIT